MKPSRTIRLTVIGLILVCTAGCDQVTKHLARTELGQTGYFPFPSRFMEFTLAENPGAFLSLGASFPPVVRSGLAVCLSGGLTFLLVYLVRAPRLRWWSLLGLALILAGGTSNLIDRLAQHGLVTDFVILRVGPIHTGVFNLADFVIVIGTLMLMASLRAGSSDRRVCQGEDEESG